MAHESCKSQIAVLEMNGQSVPQRWTSKREGKTVVFPQSTNALSINANDLTLPIKLLPLLNLLICSLLHNLISVQPLVLLARRPLSRDGVSTSPNCWYPLPTLKRPLSGRGQDHVTQFRNFGTPL